MVETNPLPVETQRWLRLWLKKPKDCLVLALKQLESPEFSQLGTEILTAIESIDKALDILDG